MTFKTMLLAFISTTFAFCSNPDNSMDKNKSSSEKVILKDTLVNSKNSAQDEHLSPENTISGKVVFRNSYCGGARPSAEILERYKQEYPLINSTILLQSIEGKKKSMKIVVDEKGNFKAKLEVGTYHYFMTNEYSKTMGASFNADCLEWLAQSFGQISIIEKQATGYNIIFSFGCNPCDIPKP